MRKKLLCTLLTAALLLSLFPGAVLADEVENTEGVETVSEEQVSVDPELLEMLPDNNELFSTYVDLTFAGADTDVPSTFGVGDPAYNQLGEKEKKIYDVLKAKIKNVAENGGSTVFDITECFKTEWTSADIGGASLSTLSGTTYSVSDAVKQAIDAELQFDSGKIVNALLLDCPYELYWFDKTIGARYAYDATYNFPKTDGSPGFDINRVVVLKKDSTDSAEAVTMTFDVAASYWGTGSTQVSGNVAKVKTAATTANTIVSNNAGKSNYDRLVAYKDAICERVSYNQNAVDTDAAYGDPWQLIDVFAGGANAQVVCEGYSKAFQYLCDLTEFQGKVESYIATGFMASDGGSATGVGAHMWNIVRINDVSYLVDVTNCDGDSQTASIGYPDKLFLAGNTGAGRNYKFMFDNGSEKDPSFTAKVSDNVYVHYLYDSDLPWGTNILTLANENYTSNIPVATTVKIYKGGEEITTDSIAIGGSASYTAKVFDQGNKEMTGEGVIWKLRDPHTGVSVNENGVVSVANDAPIGQVFLVVTPSGYTVQSPPTSEIAINITEKPAVITPIDASWIVAIPDHTYTGNPIEPVVALVNGGVNLNESSDYKVEYSNNVNAGTATVKVTGINKYSGTAVKNFKINPAEIQKISITAPSALIYANDEKNTSIKDLKTLLNLLDSTEAFYGNSGSQINLNVTWQSPAESSFNKLGGTYIFTGTVETGNNFKPYTGKLEAKVEVTPINVRDIESPESLSVKNTELGTLKIPETINITYDHDTANGPVNVKWDKTLNDLQAEADKLAEGTSTTVTLTAKSVGFPDWATVPAGFAMPTLQVTITTKEKADIKISNPSSLGWVYGSGTPTEPEVTGTAGSTTVSKENCTFSYTGTTLNGTSYGPSEEVPTDAGTYTVTAIYNDETYYGTASAAFNIKPKEVELTWQGTGEGPLELPLTYTSAPANVTASIPEGSLMSGDTCTVTVTGGNQADAGSYEATAVLSNKNYFPMNDKITYTIHKGDRGMYISDGPQDISWETLNLYPATGLSKEILVSYNNPDNVNPTFEVTEDAAAIRLVSNNNIAAVTAVGNGHATLTVSFAETKNFKSTSVSCTLEALANPVSQISIGSKVLTASLSGKLDGNTIKVVGLGDPKDISVKLLLATDIVDGLTQDPDSDAIIANGDKISVKDGDNLVAEYTVDLSGVTSLPENTTVTEAKGTATAPEDASGELKEAAEKLDPKSSGLVGAAKDLILEAAELAKTEGADSVTIEASLKVEVKSLDTTSTAKTFRLDVTPVYTISTITAGVESEKIEKPIANEQLSSDVKITVSVKLPENFPKTNVFARHYKNGAVAEILRVLVDEVNGMASWEQSSFSEIELFSETRHGSITLKMDDGSQETVNIDATSLGTALPTRTKEGYIFKGWKIGGTVYTTVTDELLTALGNGSTLNAEAQFEKKDTPVTPPGPETPETPSTPSHSGGGGGGSSSSVSRKISIGKTSNGDISSSHLNPTKGTKVTLTAKPRSGYVLESLRVLDAKGKEVELTRTDDGKYTFIMPDGKVTVDAQFVKEGEQSQTNEFPFTDAADSWAKDAIAWAYENGYVNGTSATTFNPDGSITRQQMWMILARLGGASPANMAEAREWAMSNGVTDGTGGGNAMTRQQMVTFLYRYGRLKGYALVGAEDVDELSGFPDSGTVSGYAQVPLAWAVVNGIVAGTSNGTLNPGGGATRAQFAVILQRFYNNIVQG